MQKKAKAFDELKHAFRAKKKKMEASEKEKSDAHTQRQFYVDKIAKFQKSLTQNFDQLMQHDLKEKANRLKDLLDKFEAKCIALGCVDSANAANQSDEEIEELCGTWQSKIAKRIDFLEKEEEAKNNAQNADIRTGSMQIEQSAQNQQNDANKSEMLTQDVQKKKMKMNYDTFSGNVFEWRLFEKQFKKDIVDSTELEDKEKLNYLSEACKDEVFELISNAGNDFAQAWQLLKDLYGDAYNQVQLCTQRFITISKANQASAQSLTSLLNKATKCVTLLKDIMPNSDDSLFTVIAASKLDDETARMWDRHRNTLAMSWADKEEVQREKNQYMPSWNDFVTFLNDEIMVYAKQDLRAQASQMVLPKAGNSEAAASSSISQNNSHKIANAVKPQSYQYGIKCPCGGCIYLYKCQDYLAYDYYQRWQYVEENNLCARCTRMAHPTMRCENKTNNEPCPMCAHHSPMVEAYHNSTLCPIRFGIHPN